MAPTPPPKLEAYIFFDNQSERPLFLRLKPQEGKLHVTLSDNEEEGSKRIEHGRIIAVLVTPDIRTCLRGNKLCMLIKFQLKTPDLKLAMHNLGQIRDAEGRGRGPLFRFMTHKG